MDNNFPNNSIAVSPTLSQERVAGNSPSSDKVADIFPIAGAATSTQQSERPNNYLYPPFAGYSGERYLDSIVQQILPNALSRTWKYAVDYQAPGKPCYVGATRISQRVKPGVRKIEMDLHELEARGLMRRYAARQPILREDGTVRNEAVVVKDFSALYALAYEYHLWRQSPEYIPPERDYVDLICADQELYHKLIRFDNYRRLLVCAKPGRKPQTTETQLFYQCQLPLDDQALVSLLPGARTPGQDAKNYFNAPANTSSSYREPKTEKNLFEKTSVSTKSLEAMTIRNEPAVQQPETERITQHTDSIDDAAENQEQGTKIEGSKPKTNETPQKEEAALEIVKEEKEYNLEDLKKNPFAMAAMLVDMQAQQIQQPNPAKRSQKPQAQRKKRGTPEQLARYIAYVVQQLGANPKTQQSDITRATKTYYAATQIFDGFTNAWFLEMVKEAFIDAARARGVKRRVPYFFKCLETRLELTPDELAFIRSPEPLYSDGQIADFQAKLRRTYEKSGTHLQYIEWVQQNSLSAPSSIV